ncbi:putative reductase [Chytridium lagenaria]|nr:putative reductase [Chytridium lagenaria]
MSNIALSATTVKLNSGTSIPQVGLGVWQTSPNEAVDVILEALKAGYRHIDTAALYGNEAEVGEAIRRSGIPRQEIFVTTKLWNDDHGYEKALKAFEKSLKKLGMDYVDLYLLHAPVEGLRLESWRALEKIYADGKAKAIGVSNYGVHHLEELAKNSTVTPAVNQVELHPYLQRKNLVEYCKHKASLLKHTVHLRAEKRCLTDPKLVTIAKKYSKSTAQILVRWGIEKGYVTLPKSAKFERLRENANVFDFKIEENDMRVLDGFEEGLNVSWDPTVWK